MEERKGGALLNGIIDILIFAYTLSVFIMSFDEDLNKYSKILALALMGMLAVYVLVTQSIRINGVVISFMGFTAFGYLSWYWAVDKATTLSRGFTLIQLLILFWLLYNYLSEENKLGMLVDQLCWSGTIFSVYIFVKNSTEGFGNILNEGGRVTVEGTNENMLGFIVGFSALLSVWNFIYRKKRSYMIFAVLNGIALLGSGSRTALIAFIFGVVLLFLLNGNGIKKLLMILAVVCVLFLIYMILQLPYFDAFMDRINTMLNAFTGEGRVDGSTRTRLRMIGVGIETFVKSPLGGIGLGNSGVITETYFGWKTYLHNNYVEMLACVGLIGATLYYAMFLVPLTKFNIRSKKMDSWTVLGIVVIFSN